MKRVISPGDMVVPNLKHGVKRLVLWAADALDVPDVVSEVGEGKILTVVEVRRGKRGHDECNKEWKKGACLVLSPEGKLGWVGIGWVKRLPTDLGTHHNPVGDDR